MDQQQEASLSAAPDKETTGLTHECGVFGCVATGEWPSQIDVAQVVCLGLVALQHRLLKPLIKRNFPAQTILNLQKTNFINNLLKGIRRQK